MNPSPRPSPPPPRRANGTVPSNMGAPVVNGFDKVSRREEGREVVREGEGEGEGEGNGKRLSL